MVRTVPRVAVNIPVVFTIEGYGETIGTSRNLGMGGVFIEGIPALAEKSFSGGETVLLEFHLPKVGNMYLWGKTLRILEGGVAARFSKLSEGDQIKLWQFMRERLEEPEECPYCGRICPSGVVVCEGCNWSLNFSSSDYFRYLRKENLIRRLENQVHLTSYDKLQRIAGILDIDISEQ